MKLFLTIILLVLLPFSANSQNLKICEKGINKCKPLIQDRDKYVRCMRLICYDNSEAQTEKKTSLNLPVAKKAEPKAKQVNLCDTGRKRCMSLKKWNAYYYECVDETCSDPTLKNTNPSCVEGHIACKPELDVYQACVKLNCGDEKECLKSKLLCSDGLNAYWSCVYRICIGPVDYFKKRKPKIEKYIKVKDKNGKVKKTTVNKIERVMSGAAPGLMKAPKGVDPEEWVRDIPSQFMITGNPSKYMKCFNPNAVMECRTRDTRSCGCSDGTPAIMINGIPKPYKVDEEK